ncbi:MAG: DUF4279 domain-containing protein [Clostridia bacterium]|nr:DUF4279 domain-containing protein [Clostridia bacterium]
MAENKMGEARFSLLLHGDELAMEQIEAALELQATRTLRKGDVINRLPLIEASADEWTHSISLTAPESADAGLNQLLAHLTARKAVLAQLQEKYNVELRLYVQSDYAQMTYSLMPETLAKLAELALPLSISSLSWGEFAL